MWLLFYIFGLCMLCVFGVMLKLFIMISFGCCCSFLVIQVCIVFSQCSLQLYLLVLMFWLLIIYRLIICRLLKVLVMICFCLFLKLGMLICMFCVGLCDSSVMLLQVFWLVNMLWQFVLISVELGNLWFFSLVFWILMMFGLKFLSYCFRCGRWILSELMFYEVIFMGLFYLGQFWQMLIWVGVWLFLC